MSLGGNGGGPFRDVQGKNNAISVEDKLARAINDGDAFSFDSDGTLAEGASLLFLGVTGDQQIHFDAFSARFSRGDMRVSLYESPTVTNNGTQQTPVNMNFSSPKTSSMQIFSAPTVSANGTLKENPFFPLTGVGVNVQPASGDVANGRVLKKNTIYLFVVKNEGTADADYGLDFVWSQSEVVL